MLRIIILSIVVLSNLFAVKNDIKLLSVDDKTTKVVVNWRFDTPKKVNNISVIKENKKIKISYIDTLNENMKTSIYFLIDTKKRMKRSYRKGSGLLVNSIIKKLNARHRYAIAGFDTTLTVINKFNDFSKSYEKALYKLPFKGRKTELYRLSIEALDYLIQEKTKRKILILISDGDSVDTTYAVKDLVKKANKHKIQILSLGYRDSVKIQGIQKPAIQTGGRVWKAHRKTNKMKPSFMSELLPYFDNGGLVKFNKKDFDETKNGLQQLTLKIDTNGGVVKKNFTIKVEKLKETNYMMYGIVIFILLVVVIFIIIKRGKKSTQRPIAYLVQQSGEKFKIVNNMTSIGRNDDNDIVIKGSYMSGYHADIIYKYDEFLISDKNSTNGIGVNLPAIKEGNNKITQSKIKNGDVIYLGPLELRFEVEEI